jgi:hypothetical protein
MGSTKNKCRATASASTFARWKRKPINAIRTALMCFGAFAATHAQAAWVNIDELNGSLLPISVTVTHHGQSIAVNRRPDGTVHALYVGVPNATVTSMGNPVAQAGIVVVFRRNNGQWQYGGYLTSLQGPSANAHFGAAVAVKNGSIIVGEPDYDAPGQVDAGRVVIFQDVNWNGQLTPVFAGMFTREGTSANGRLGASVAVSGSGIDSNVGDVPGDGSWFTAGAPGANGTGCLFFDHLDHDVRGAGDHQDMGSVCAPGAGDALGASVAINSLGVDSALVLAGAPGTIQNGNATAGAARAYVRANGNWLLIDTLTANNPAIFDFFGTSVAIDEVSGHVYVGGTGRDLAGVGRTGSVTRFAPAFLLGYDFDRELFPTAPRAPGDLCGATVNVDLGGDAGFIMGCPSADGSVANQGAVRVYRPFNFMGSELWLNQLVQLVDEPHAADDFGRSAILVDDRLYAGAPLYDDGVGTYTGAVFEFANGLVIDAMFSNGFEN